MGGHHTVDRQTYENATNEYRESMLKVLQGINKALKPAKYFALLIGDGIVKGRKVKANELIQEIAKLTGFEQTSIISIPLKEVSRRFIKGTNNNEKLHHVITLHKIRNIELD
jgi:hypothetical protein